MNSARTDLLIAVRDPGSGKLDARRTGETFGLTMRELAQVLGRDPSGLSKHPTSNSLQEPLHELEELGLHLRGVFGDLGIGRRWLRAPNPVLGGRSPVSYLLDGRRLAAVERLLLLAETGTPT